jgi:hypothetical protein
MKASNVLAKLTNRRRCSSRVSLEDQDKCVPAMRLAGDGFTSSQYILTSADALSLYLHHVSIAFPKIVYIGGQANCRSHGSRPGTQSYAYPNTGPEHAQTFARFRVRLSTLGSLTYLPTICKYILIGQVFT